MTACRNVENDGMKEEGVLLVRKTYGTISSLYNIVTLKITLNSNNLIKHPLAQVNHVIHTHAHNAVFNVASQIVGRITTSSLLIYKFN
jgi:hypothetical protein